ncbi:MAG: hypothetical protein DCC71_05175 [Proteobacteria bacterium]|nr:MAG: hypothetical protein DCC71_05175 [Pseudomonadota bacterium]
MLDTVQEEDGCAAVRHASIARHPFGVTAVRVALAAALAAGGLLAASGSAGAAPTPRFVATPVQGSVCVAPCVVHLDATATTSSEHARPFSELDYAWDCGEPGAGTWSNRTGGDKNRPRGPVTGCVYPTPGAKTIRLTVREPDGEVASSQTTVTIANPDSVFAGTNTVCISASGNFSGCPTGAQRVTSSDFDAALTSNAGCNADAAHKRCLLRCGETFSQDQGIGLAAGTTPALLSCYGSASGRANVVSTTGFGAVERGWTLSRLDWSNATAGSNGLGLSHVNGNITLYDNAITTRGGSNATHPLAGDRHPDLVAIVGDVHTILPTGSDRYSQHFLRARRQLILGNVFDANGEGEFNLRSIHTPLSAIQHNELIDPQDDAGNVRNPLQLRAFSEPSGTGLPRAPTQYVVVSDNVLESPMTGSSTGTAIRTCQEPGCNRSPGQGENMMDLLFERNFIRATSPAANANAGVFYLQGGRITVRSNVVDLQGVSGGSDVNALVNHVSNQTLCPSCVDDEIVVQGNTMYWGETSSRGIRLCSSSTGAGHVCQANLAWLPRDSGDRIEAGSGAWTTGGNVFATSNPFAATPRGRGLTTAADFLLSATSPARNRLATLAARTALPRDHGLRCRLPSATGAYDAGAWEHGATDCSGGAPLPAVCGNGIREGAEQCDDGNLVSGDGCSSACSAEPICGNGTREGSEQCDDGNRSSGDGCSSSCTREPVCGDGTREGSEQCDDGNRSSGDGCSSVCTNEIGCGNGTREGSEQCDDGNRTSGDGCSSACLLEFVCGNGVTQGTEQCDDGNRVSGDGCSAGCLLEVTECGQGVLEPGEDCDDGNAIGGDGCRPNCTVEACGDGVLDGPEGCDDGNLASGDGCSARCTVEGELFPIGVHLNLGGDSFVGSAGTLWIDAPQWVRNGREVVTLAPVAGTTNDTVYWSRIAGAASGPPLRVDIPLGSDGAYRVLLHYAELEGRAPGQRVFDVDVDGAFVIEDVDVASRVGAARAWVQELYVHVDDALLTLRFVPRVGEPMVSAIEVTAEPPPEVGPRFVPQGCEGTGCQ